MPTRLIISAIITEGRDAGKKIRIADKELVEGRPSKQRYTVAGSKAFSKRGAVLVLCRGRGTALKRARQIARTMERINAHNTVVQTVYGEANGIKTKFSVAISEKQLRTQVMQTV